MTGIEFDADSQIPESLRPQLTKDAQPPDLHVASGEADLDWINVPSNAVRETLQSQGYFKALVEVTPFLIRAESKQHFYVLRFHIESGPQYRLGDLRFENAKVFSPALLRAAFILQPGDLFDVSKIREPWSTWTLWVWLKPKSGQAVRIRV
jgi:outer membrane translocation and assembly module TamA